MADSPAGNKTHWELEDSDPELAGKARAALGAVHDPELGLTIIQLGMIRDIQLSENQMIVSMLLTTPYCPYGPAILEQARNAVETATGITTRINLLMEPWDMSMMEDGAMPEWGLY